VSDADKRVAAEAAVAEVQDGMLLGLGTGSTAAHAIRAIGARVAEGLKVDAVATSHASDALARELGIRVHDFADVAAVDLTIDGADEIDGALRAIKGAGGAMLREKAVAAASARMVVIADGSKRVERLGAAALPVEVLPFARAFVTRRLGERAKPVLRMAGDAPYLTDQGNLVLDCRFAALDDPADVAAWLQAIPGVMAHGLFLSEVAAAYLARDGEVTRLERPA
jgi:ribose 5-phosphate isomerase A